MVDLTRLELVTSRLSAGRSDQLSYRSNAGVIISQDACMSQHIFLEIFLNKGTYNGRASKTYMKSHQLCITNIYALSKHGSDRIKRT